MTNNNKVILLLFVLLSLGVSLLYSPWFQSPGYDKEIYQYIGMAISKGDLPYKDVFDHRTPLIYFLNAIFIPFGAWGPWILDVIGLLVGIFSLYRLSQKLNSDMLWPSVFVYIIFMRFPLLYESGGGLTRTIAAPMTITWVSFFFEKGKCWDLLLGFLLGMIFLVQQNEILAPVGCLIVSVCYKEKKLENIFRIFLGLAIPISIFFVWLSLNNLWVDFIKFAFNFNQNYIDSNLSTRARLLVEALKEVRLLLPLIFCFLAVISGLLKNSLNRNNQYRCLVLLSATIFQTISVSLSGHFYPHYFIMFSPILAFGWCFSGCLNVKKYLVFFLWAMSIFYTIRIFYYSEHIKNLSQENSYENSLPQLDEYLSHLRDQKGQFYVMKNPSLLGLNIKYKIRSPSKWVYMHFWDTMPLFDSDGKKFESILTDLDQYQTTYILDYSNESPFKEKRIQMRWDVYLGEHYDLIKKIKNGGRFFKRKT